MAKLTEERIREIIREAMAKINVRIELDGKTIAQSLVDEIRKQTGERL